MPQHPADDPVVGVAVLLVGTEIVDWPGLRRGALPDFDDLVVDCRLGHLRSRVRRPDPVIVPSLSV
jgi:hypothetical protein